jgi:predicted DNA-binding transcriptional regulator AlpA
MTFNPDRKRLRKNQVAQRNGCHPRTIDNRVRSGAFPPPHRDEIGRPFWWSDEIAQHEATLTGAHA